MLKINVSMMRLLFFKCYLFSYEYDNDNYKKGNDAM